MFGETTGSRKAIGDVDVLYHEGLYHLFHLVLPNHDFIAHAVSTDGIHWRRLRNAIFIGDPGSWDDLMLWTMHVSPDPHREGSWRMFYTGLSRRDSGMYQRIGLALSDDLYTWRKHPAGWKDERGPEDPDLIKKAREASCREPGGSIEGGYDENSCFPLSPDAEWYEADLEEGRHLVSFRDPFFYQGEEKNYLLVAGRVNHGPVVRRGCVAVFTEAEPYCFSAEPPLHHPALYDDVEVPNLIRIEEQDYLIGSIREDAKIRYWHGDCSCSEWRSYHDNVLMPQGNYAGRVCRDEKGWLLWCFFAMNRADRTDNNLMPPPKRIVRDESGQLYLQTYEQFEKWLVNGNLAGNLTVLNGNGGDSAPGENGKDWKLSSPRGFQGFLFEDELESFHLKCRVELKGKGKCGFLFRLNGETHDGYYLSLDLLKGVAQMRAWGTDTQVEGEHMMSFETLQSGYWKAEDPGNEDISLLAFGSYLEVSIGGKIVLSLADQSFDTGRVGIYLDTAELQVKNVSLHKMHNPEQLDSQIVSGRGSLPD